MLVKLIFALVVPVVMAAQPLLVKLPPENVFIPVGFDDNDDVQIVIAGTLPDTCHKIGPVTVEADHAQKRIVLKTHGYLYQNAPCVKVQVTYAKSVSLGLLVHGDYHVFVNPGEGPADSGKAGVITVAQSHNEGPDDYLYAPVTEAAIETPGTGGNPTLVLRGTFSNSCMKLREIRTIANPAEVISVLPIAEMAEGTAPNECRDEKRPFEGRVELKGLRAGRSLIHIRSLDGQSLNRIVER